MTPAASRARDRNAAGSGTKVEQPGLVARQVATRLLGAVVDARTPLDGLTDAANGHPQYRALDERDRSLVRAILVSALRRRGTVSRLVSDRLDRPLPPNAHALNHILHVALAQILFLDIPDSAAVDIAVEQAKADPRTVRFAALVNAVLRGVVRAGEPALAAAADAGNEVPDWFARRLASAYGEEKAAAILAMQKLEPTTDFTVRDDAAGWAGRLGGVVLPTGSVRVERLAATVPELPGYGEGAWWVQDAAAALPARLFGDLKGKRVADLCAAPGGKTAQLALAGAQVTAVEKSPNRLKRLAVNLERLRLGAETVCADIATYQPEQSFDAILLDAPCSSTGTVRRHPDVAWTKDASDITKLAGVQRRLLDRAFAMLKPAGVLVFSNCSLDPEEGEELIAAFLAQTPSARLDPIDPASVPGIEGLVAAQGWLRTTPADLDQATPAMSGMDGFFAARIVKAG